jgi:hypothetical protein
VKSSRILIEHQCPQCGAPATLEETDHLFACQFCRVKSYLLSKDFFRYTLPSAAPENKDLIFVPYWRFKGLLFSCVEGGIRHRIVDVSHQALNSKLFPYSLGLRSQVLKLRFVTPESEGRFLHPDIAFEKMLKIILARFSEGLSEPVFHQEFIGETLSQIHSPFYVDTRLYDAILNRPVSTELPKDFNVSGFPGGKPDWRIHFAPALCPDCGWDLAAERDSLVLICRNCDSAWYPGKSKFTKLQFGYIPARNGKLTYLPFYRIKAEVTGMTLESYADLARVANLPRVIREPWKDRRFYFWSPAFKVRPGDFLRFAGNVTLQQPREMVITELPDAEMYPVTLPIMEAVESQKLNLAGFMKPRKLLFPRLPEIEIEPRSFLLVYIPFYQNGNELSQPAYRLRIDKCTLDFARHL